MGRTKVYSLILFFGLVACCYLGLFTEWFSAGEQRVAYRETQQPVATATTVLSDKPFPLPAPSSLTDGCCSWNTVRQTHFINRNIKGNDPAITLTKVWSTPCQAGHASPVVFGNQILVVSGGAAGIEVTAYALDSGEQVWNNQISDQSVTSKHPKGAPVSSTPIPANDKLIICFDSGGEVWMAALQADGGECWRTRLGPTNAQWGFNSSPVTYRGLGFVNVDNEHAGFVVAIDVDTGRLVWQQPRPDGYEGSYSSPLLVTDDSGQSILVLAGLQCLVGLDAASGSRCWALPAVSDVSAATPTFRNGFLVASSGYRNHHLIALKFGESVRVQPKPLWAASKPSEVPYVPTSLLTESALFVVQDEGLAQAYEIQSGKALWKKRLGFTVTASPTWLNGTLFVCGENGRCVTLEPATGNKLFELELDEPVFASPTVHHSVLFIRSREALHCFRFADLSEAQ